MNRYVSRLERSDVMNAIRMLGCDPAEVRTVTMETDVVSVEVYVFDSKGDKVMVDNDVETRFIEFRIVG